MISKDDFKQKINSVCEKIKANDSTNAVSELLGVIDDFNQGVDELTTANASIKTLEDTNTNLTSSNQELKDLNINLLLRVGAENSNNITPTPNINNQDQGEEKKPLKYEDLFNEKGELK